VLLVLNQQITSYTEYWPFVLGTILIVLLFVFPGGIVGALAQATRLIALRATSGPPNPTGSGSTRTGEAAPAQGSSIRPGGAGAGLAKRDSAAGADGGAR